MKWNPSLFPFPFPLLPFPAPPLIGVFVVFGGNHPIMEVMVPTLITLAILEGYWLPRALDDDG